MSDRTASGLLRSSVAATLSQIWRYGVAFVTRVLLRRGEVLVSQAGWGLWHWSVDTVFALLAQVRDLGVPAHVVRSRPRPWGNFLALEAVWGAVLGLGVVVVAPWLAGELDFDPRSDVVRALRLLVLFFVCEGLARVPLTWFECELRLDRTLLPEVVRNLVWAGLAVALAVAGWGYWSLFVGHVAGTAVFAVFLWARAWGEMPLTWVPGGTWPLVRASLPLAAVAFLFLLLTTVDFLVLGARFPAEVVGRYGAAFELSLLVSRVLELPIRRPLYPALFALASDAARFFTTYRLATVLLLCLQVPAALFLIVNAETVLVLLFAEEYASAAPFLRLLAAALLLQPFGRCAEDALLARHEERLVIAYAIANLAAFVGLGWWLTGLLGPVGMAWAHLLPAGELVLAWAVWRISRPGLAALVRQLGWVYLLPVPAFAAAFLLTEAGWGRLLASAAAGLVTVGLYAWRFGGEARAYFRTTGEVRAGAQ